MDSPMPEALLKNLEWTRALARRLVQDEHMADDVAQEACVIVQIDQRQLAASTCEAFGHCRPESPGAARYCYCLSCEIHSTAFYIQALTTIARSGFLDDDQWDYRGDE